MRPSPIDVALAPRLALAAQALAERVPNNGAWRGYRATEPLESKFHHPDELGNADTVTCWRRDHPEATVTLGFLSMVAVHERECEARQVIESGIEKRVRYEIDLDEGETLELEWEKELTDTVSYAEAAKSAWEAAAKASLSVGYGGINGAVEVSGRYGEELSRQHGGSHSERDRKLRKLTLRGPLRVRKEGYRAHNRESQVVRAVCDFDGKLYWWGGEGSEGREFTMYRTQFLPVIRRTAAAEIIGSDDFRRQPMSDAEIEALEAPSGLLVEYVVEYDAVTTLVLRNLD